MSFRLWTNSSRFSWTRGRGRKARPKTFKSEESAKKWAEAQGIKEYVLENSSLNEKKPKIRVVAKS